MSKDQIKDLKQEQAALRQLTYKDDAITARLETIYRLLEKHATT
jgi:hypothetical protein